MRYFIKHRDQGVSKIVELNSAHEVELFLDLDESAEQIDEDEAVVLGLPNKESGDIAHSATSARVYNVGEIVGYVSKAGRTGSYKLKKRAKNKFGAGFRVCLQSFGDKPISFWVDENLLCAPPINKNNGCGCECEECQPFCRCARKPYQCNCLGGQIYDC